MAWQIRREHTRTALIPRQGVIALLAALKVQQYQLALVSDCSSEVPDLWPETAFAAYFDYEFSCLAHCMKPDPRAYLECL